MQLTTSLVPGALGADAENLGADAENDDRVDAAIVIDVLRASSVIVTGLASGARQVITTRGIDEAVGIASQRSEKPLLCGERGCVKIEGFDLGNSPDQYTREIVFGRDLVLTTTNGTRAIESATQAKRVLIGCFLNLSAVVQRLDPDWHVRLVCAGTAGAVTLEDVLFAGAVVTLCETRCAVQSDDASVVARQTWESWFGNAGMPSAPALERSLRESLGGRNLLKLGFGADIRRCAQIDVMGVVPERFAESPALFALP
ncbi:2-phosphosulfolactate phosphatase [Novipirellula artificiosorum]|uniref:Probable 2-phosphosulfolactate phosphatase n=1 Tax=Novipirellula artificiosorum TaxID=2528016 RepID=A0A5C6DR31_9BACT|nr:2-phosphosulfolactate phosphatase [Novipirellula artificiosorum]TWU37219.1 putative 2-phosphosulfolactate phosphatase [Novipirellula artificiosorum]